MTTTSGEVTVEMPEPTMALAQISKAEIDVAIATAHKFPRQIAKVKSDMLSFATLDQETAEGCFYSLPRGGKTIQGPSVRLAEIATSCYGNLRAGSRILETVTTGDTPHVVVQAVAHDLEHNVSISIEKRRRIIGKKDFKTGARKPIDEDDINLATNACSAIAFRDAIFKCVPLALVKPVMEAAKKVAIGDAKTLVDRRAKAVEAFAKMGVKADRVFSTLGVKGLDDVTLEHLETLLGLHTAIREGTTTVDEAFPAATPAIGKAKVDKTFLEAPAVCGPGSNLSSQPEARDAEGPPATPTATDQPPVSDATNTGEGGASAASAAPSPASPPPTPIHGVKEELAGIIIGGGWNFDQFHQWLHREYKVVSDYDSFDQLPQKLTADLLKSRKGLVASMGRMFPKEAK